MKKLMMAAAVLALAVPVMADMFGTGANQFTIDFVPISGSTNLIPSSGIVNDNYRMGKFEITNDQWNKFKAAYGSVNGSPFDAYDENPFWTSTNVPTNKVSWYEAAQFVNWLNTSTGHHAAYKFTGIKGQSSGYDFPYTFDVWNAADAWGVDSWGSTNLYRHKDAFYFLPTQDEWVTAAYWNGTSLQQYATKAGESLFQGNGSNGGWNYSNPAGPWAVGSGSQELNGTYDMMGNVWEWTESPNDLGNYWSGAFRDGRGGSYDYSALLLSSNSHLIGSPIYEHGDIGFRVASVIPEPTSLLFLAMGAIIFKKKF